jgi:glycosyltransferase involved in cell wall biosynthesis
VSIALRTFKTKYFTLPFCSFECNEDGLLVYRLFTRVIPKLQKINHILWAKRTVKLFEKYQRRHGTPDIIHAHFALWGGYAAYLIKQKYGVPYVITEHFSIMSNLCDYSQKSFKNWQTPYYEKTYSNADFIAPVSKVQIPKIQTFLTKKAPIAPISNVINTDFFHYKERKNDTEKVSFVSINGFYIQKGYDILLPAFDNACEKNKNLEITIVGENFEQKEFQNTLWKNVKNKDKFHFTGELTAEGVRRELWNADCYIMPSRAEGQPQATLEALCTGLPMVCTEVVPDNVATKDNSIRIPVEDIEMMTDAILKLSATYKNYDGKAISEHIAGICSKNAFAESIIKVYKQVINQ